MRTKIAIIGKTNTGKSTLFNRLIGFRKAIVLREAGITRDRNYGNFSWQGREFTLIDTGGVDYTSEQKSIQQKILDQSKKAIIESDFILFLVDVMTGIQQEDLDIAKFIRRKNKESILVVNKDDIKEKNYFKSDFFRLGLGEPSLISAEQGINIGDLMDRIVSLVPEKYPFSKKDKDCCISVAIIGKPNVGKSSILNALLNDERMIVDDIPGTTRDAIEYSLDFREYRIQFIDTSGLRRKSSVRDGIEYFGNIRTIDSIKKSDIVLLVLDASHAISMQDKRLANRILEEKKACIVLLNKYDLVRNQKEIDKKTLLQMSRYDLRFLKDTRILTTIAAGSNKIVAGILDAVIEVYKECNQRISTSQLNSVVQKIVQEKPPKIVNGRRIHFFYITQTGVNPPAFRLFVNDPDLLYNSYRRYLENQFIKFFRFKGIPIVFQYQKRKK